MKKIVVIGGGTGLSAIMRSLKNTEGISLAAVVTVADDGGSTGRLRERYDLPAMGDIRNVLVSMADDENLFSKLMAYRFEGEDDVGGHNLGNLILTALNDTYGNFSEAIHQASRFLKVKGEIIPSSLEVITLFAEMENGKIVRGESQIPKVNDHVKRVFYDCDVKASEDAVNAIRNADVLIFGIGSLYTSIIPNIIINDLGIELVNSQAKKVYICNAMSQPGETDNYSVEDHVQALYDHLPEFKLDTVLVHESHLDYKVINRYLEQGAKLVKLDHRKVEYEIVKRDLLTVEDERVRHDKIKMESAIKQIVGIED